MSDPSNTEFDLPPRRPTIIYRCCQRLSGMIATIFFDLKAYDIRNVPDDGAVLLLSNHQSFLDPVLVGSKLRRSLCYMARSGLFKPPGFGWLIRQLNSFPVKQGKGDVGAVKTAIAALEQGHGLLLFPEGSRTRTGQMQPLAAGAALIIKRAKVPVIPVAIDGAFKAWPITRMFPQTSKVRVIYGKPMNLDGMDGRQIVAAVEAEIRRLLAVLQEKPR
jgi:1-acyl-sn-glycerol-3-phosphate acyltransferase